jgi:ABC-type bacteriocin/lantibiotic exporter with double-glycine peptidase domain
MNMKGVARAIVVWGLAAGHARCVEHSNVRSDQEQCEIDCGAIALYECLALHGMKADLEVIARELPVTGGRGRAMYDLMRVGRRLGLPLEGSRVDSVLEFPDTACVIYLKLPAGGHYVVGRPVGFTGKLIQILDGYQEPAVVAKQELIRSIGWTGLTLRAKSRWTLGKSVVQALCLACGLYVGGVGGVWLWKRRMER